MLEQLAFFLIALFVVVYLLTKDIFHPATIMSGLWMFMVNLYAFTEHPLYPLSNKFCIALTMWVVPFVLVSVFIVRIACSTISPSTQLSPKIHLYLKMYPYVIAYALLYLGVLLIYSKGSFVNLRNYLVYGDFPPFLKFLMYLNNLMIVYVTYGILNYRYFSKKKIVILLLLLLVVSLFNSNKTGFLSIFISALFLYKYLAGRISFKIVLYLFVVLLALLVLVTSNRGDLDYLSSSENPVMDYLYTYFLSPLAAFDYLLNSNYVLESGAPGSATFSFFYSVFNALGANYQIADLGGWVHVPLITNVFTIMRGYYLDWGMDGIFVMSIVMGGIWGLLYALQKKKYQTYVLFYALIVCYLFFQTFGDYFWHSMSIVIQYYLFSLFLNVKYKISIQ